MTNKAPMRLIGAIVATVMIPASAHACEPAVPLTMLLVPYLTASWSLVLLLAVIAAKCLLFALWQRGLPGPEAAGYMLAANFGTTVLGLVPAMALAAPAASLPFAPAIFALIFGPADRAMRSLRAANRPANPRARAAALAAVMTLCFYLALFLFFFSAEAVGTSLYWIFKLGYIYPALGVGICLSILWEEWIVNGLAKSRFPDVRDYYRPVIRANLAALFILMAVSAIHMLPARLGTAGFLVGR